MAATKPPPKIQKESIWRTLPRACFGLIAAVVLDVVAMLGYATLLLMDGASPSAFYFAAVVLTGAFILVFFTMSAVLSENTIELLATVCVGTCVTIMVFWLRLGGGNLDQVQRTTERGGMMDDLFPDPAQKQFVLTLGALATQGTIQIAFVVFGYLSYKDFGWRIFKLFGTDLGMRQVYETYLAIRSGYRSVPLRDRNGCLVAFSSLFCHFRSSHTHLPPELKAQFHRYHDQKKRASSPEGRRSTESAQSAGVGTATPVSSAKKSKRAEKAAAALMA